MAYTYTPDALALNSMANGFGQNQLLDTQAQNIKNANDFEDSMPQTSGQMYTAAEGQAKSNLNDQQKNIRTAANSRGLLYSGLRQGAEQGAATNTANNLAATRVGINQGVDQLSNQYNQQAINTGMDAYKGQVSAAFNSYQQALNNQQQQQQMFGSLLGAGTAIGGAALMASDKNLKTDITPGDDRISEFLDNLEPHSYKYKDPDKFGEGEHTGVMAQDLEKSDIGKSLVTDTPEGKMVNYTKAAPAILASQVALNNRLKNLESKAG